MTNQNWDKIKEFADTCACILLCGWINNIRSHKSIVFFSLKKSKLEVQCLVKDNPCLLEKINKIPVESYIVIKGTVRYRQSNFVNNKLPLGDIEVIVESVVTERKSNPLPFQVENAHNCSDEIKQKYRFLSLRNTIEYNKLEFRHKVIQLIRLFFYEKGFIEVNTPIITKSTPEGAQDYLVLSQKHVGETYALPQSPQLYKQLLMMGGVDKYFQIAPCFRDEASRKNRLPTEFYQLDIELNHANKKEAVMSMCDELFEYLFEKYLPNKVVKKMTIDYSSAIERYGCENYDQRVIEIFNVKVEESCLVFENVHDVVSKLSTAGIKVALNSGRVEVVKSHPKLNEVYTILSEICNSVCNYTSYCWVKDFPFYGLDEQSRRVAGHNPFCKKVYKVDEFGNEHIYAEQYDLVINGEEIGGGSVRETSKEELLKTFRCLGYDDKESECAFGGFIRGLEFGVPDHAGIAFGIERLCCLMYGEESKTRDFVAFPFLQNGRDVLLNTPVHLEDSVLKKYGFKNREK